MYTDHDLVLMSARSIELFCEGDSEFVFGEWKAWRNACQKAGLTLPPAAFKKRATNVDHIETIKF